SRTMRLQRIAARGSHGTFFFIVPQQRQLVEEARLPVRKFGANGYVPGGSAPPGSRARIGLGGVERPPPRGDLLRAEPGSVAVVQLPGRVLAPALRRLHRRARPARGFQ